MAHICGSFGCEYYPDDDERDGYVTNRRMDWAQKYYDKHGEFPGYEAQIRFIIRETDRYNQVIGPRIHAERYRRKVEDAETDARREYMRRPSA